MAILKKKLKASTLIEVVVAMLISAICFSLAFATLGQLLVSRMAEKEMYTQRIVRNLMEQSVREENYLADEFEAGDFRILKEVRPYPQKGLLELHIIASDLQGKLVTESRRLVYVHE